jgi:type I restriction enzyme S subunit
VITNPKISLEKDKEYPFIEMENIKGFGSTEFFVFKHREGNSDSSFIYYLSFSEMIRKPAEKSMFGASGRQRADLNVVQDLEIEVPPLPIQRKIAAILSAYDGLIENNTRRIQILEELAQTIYKEWFVKFRFPGYEKVKIVDSELGEIPEGWRVKRLGDVSNIVMGQSPSSKIYNTNGEGLPFHQGVKDFGARFPSHKTYCTVDKRLAEKGDVLVSVRAPVGRINIANTKIIVGRGLAALRHEGLLQSFLFYQLKNIFAGEDSMGSGSIFNAITKEDMSNKKFLAPNKSIDRKFNELIGSLDKQIEILQSQIENLKNTRDLLSPKLISGEIDVENTDINMEELEE